MPTISWFYGISIRMFFADHAPPHFHAVMGRQRAMVSIETGEILKGDLPPTARRLVREWTLRYNEQLKDVWDIGQRADGTAMGRIPGLDADD